ncbi:unnamed protein product [Ixodes pacificus]
MPPSAFDAILGLLGDRIRKEDTNFRKAIPPDVRLALAIRFLAAEEMLRSVSYNFLTARSTRCEIIPEVCSALWEVLGPVYVACPKQPEQWKKIATEFEERWNVPNCVGAIDGKHITIECPSLSGQPASELQGIFQQVLVGN